MPSTTARRPLPALVALVVLLVLTGIVWWRVLNRSTATPTSKPCPTSTVKVHLPAPQSITVEVLNATKRKGIATRVRSTLVEDGFNSPDLAGNDRKNLNKVKGVALIRYGGTGATGATGAQGAALLRYYFPGAQVTAASTIKSATVVVSLGTGYRAIASPTAVQKALERDKAVSGTPAPTPGSTCGT